MVISVLSVTKFTCLCVDVIYAFTFQTSHFNKIPEETVTLTHSKMFVNSMKVSNGVLLA